MYLLVLKHARVSLILIHLRTWKRAGDFMSNNFSFKIFNSFKIEYLPCAASCLKCMGHTIDDCVLCYPNAILTITNFAATP